MHPLEQGSALTPIRIGDTWDVKTAAVPLAGVGRMKDLLLEVLDLCKTERVGGCLFKRQVYGRSSAAPTLQRCRAWQENPVDPTINEHYLWHGCKPEGAEGSSAWLLAVL